MTNTFHGQLYGSGTRLINDGIKSYMIFDHGPLLFVLASYLYHIITGTCVVAAGGWRVTKDTPGGQKLFCQTFYVDNYSRNSQYTLRRSWVHPVR
jgi:hypothetical protein